MSTWGHGSGSRPGFAANGVRAATENRPRSGIGDSRAHAHEADGLVRPVGPLVDVVARLELAGEPLGQDVDALQPLHRRDGVPLGNDQPEGAPWSAPSGAPFISYAIRISAAGSAPWDGGSARTKVRSSLSVSGSTGWRWYAPVVGAFESDVDVFGGREASGPNPRLSVSVGERFLTDVHDADVGDAATRCCSYPCNSLCGRRSYRDGCVARRQ